eukprot:Awhi_evm1s2472
MASSTSAIHNNSNTNNRSDSSSNINSNNTNNTSNNNNSNLDKDDTDDGEFSDDLIKSYHRNKNQRYFNSDDSGGENLPDFSQLGNMSYLQSMRRSNSKVNVYSEVNNNNDNNNNSNSNNSNNNQIGHNSNTINGDCSTCEETEYTRSASVISRGKMSSKSRTKSRRSQLRLQLRNLKELFEEGYLSQAEYERRKDQLVDQLTGTSLNGGGNGDNNGNGSAPSSPQSHSPVPSMQSIEGNNINASNNNNNNNSSWKEMSKNLPLPCTLPSPGFLQDTIEVIPHDVPTYQNLPVYDAIRHTFDFDKGRWRDTKMKVQIDDVPFARGGLRYAYYMRIPSQPGKIFYAKASIDPYEDKQTYFQDVEMQEYCKKWADRYNVHKPPKKVDFIQADLMTLTGLKEKPLFVIEEFIEGQYKKHNNNAGFVSEEDRNTPQAFSHFTYESSQKVILVCDIQGVGDMYTDPQLHSCNGEGFGKGNLGARGFERFLATHHCNAICAYLRLPSVNAKGYDAGTLPRQQFMNGPLEMHSLPFPPHVYSRNTKFYQDPQFGGSQYPPTTVPTAFSSCCTLI